MPELDIPHVLQADGLVTTTIAILLFFVGRRLNQRFAWLRRYSIPEPVVGGLFCAIVVGVLYYGFGRQVQFTLDARDVLLLYFFAAIGLNSDVRTLRQGGWPLLILVLLAGGFILLQNGVGMAVASAFGMDPRAGLMTGSVSLT
ncbi:MAG: sodium/glutamate symporter, partial [Lysobacteraceae bacterium]